MNGPKLKIRENSFFDHKELYARALASSFSGVSRKRWIYVGTIAGIDVEESLFRKYVIFCHVNKLVSRGNNSSVSVDVLTEDIYKTIMNEKFRPFGYQISF